MLNHRTSLSSFKKTETTHSIFSDHSKWNQKATAPERWGKSTNVWKFNNIYLSNQWVRKEGTGEIRKNLETEKMKTHHDKSYGVQWKQCWEFITINTYTKKEERSQINYIILYLKELEKQQMKTKASRGRNK